MKLTAYSRYDFTAQMWLPLENPNSQSGGALLTYIKDVEFDFTDDPTAPRQVIVASEPFPVATELSVIVDRYGVPPIPGAIYTVTSIEPVISVFGSTEIFRHQAALKTHPDFGYEGIVRN